uniref:Thrombin-like enzyme gyroxin B1.3 n=1 Tax=Zeugodacus cucurbitae TaxID=28588 RepID=A0A0A1WYM0_ZEUCU
MSNMWICNDLSNNPETEFTAPQCFLDQQHPAMSLNANDRDLPMVTRIKMEPQEEYEMNINNTSMQRESSVYSESVQMPIRQEFVVPNIKLENVETIQKSLDQELLVPEIKLEIVETESTEEQEYMPEESLANIHTNNYEETGEPQVMHIGPRGTTILADDFKKIRWSTVSSVTRSLLEIIFDRQTLETHTLSGKPSPAFLHLGRPVKRQLNPKKVEDIICYVRAVFNCSVKEIRMSITTKCADLARRRRD